MVTTAQEYYSKLNLILNENPPTYAVLPTAENIYNIDINTRVIDAPNFLSIEKDHKAETIYFIVDRYADYMDLATTCCLITYTNAKNQSRVYSVPFYDIYTYARDRKMLIPWCLDATVAAAAGLVHFSISFYKVGTIVDSNGISQKILTFNLNTLEATSKVLEGMEVDNLDSEYLLNAGQFEIIQSQLDLIEKTRELNWTILSE